MKIFNKNKGDLGENIAIRYLKNKGYRILDRNYKTKYAEIDIIAIKNKIISFIEVKSRTSEEFGFPYEAVNNKKINKIRTNSLFYINENCLDYEGISFDIIEVYLKTKEINHIQNAF